MEVWLYVVLLGCTRACVCRCDGDVICVCHDLNRCTGWWYVCSGTPVLNGRCEDV